MVPAVASSLIQTVLLVPPGVSITIFLAYAPALTAVTVPEMDMPANSEGRPQPPEEAAW
jgi:hypothetical protein